MTVDAPADWVAVLRVRKGQPVGRDLFKSEWLEVMTWAARAGVADPELATMVIQSDGRPTHASAIQKRRERWRDLLPADARHGVGLPVSVAQRLTNIASPSSG